MHERESARDVGVAQVAIKAGQLVGAEQSLVDHRPRRKARDVQCLPFGRRLRRGAFHRPADAVQGPLERMTVFDIPVERALDDEELADDGQGTQRGAAEDRRVDRHVAPAEQTTSVSVDRRLDRVLRRAARVFVGRQEDHADAVLSRVGKPDPGEAARRAQKRVRELQEDAGTVARLGVTTARASMAQVDEQLEAVTDDAVRPLAVKVRDEPDAAGRVLVRGIVEPFRARKSLQECGRGQLPVSVSLRTSS